MMETLFLVMDAPRHVKLKLILIVMQQKPVVHGVEMESDKLLEGIQRLATMATIIMVMDVVLIVKQLRLAGHVI